MKLLRDRLEEDEIFCRGQRPLEEDGSVNRK
jgi:hypothetical protein